MDKVKYSFGYMFKYSERPGTLAAKKLEDNVDEKTKSRRLSEIVDLQQKHSMYRSKQFIGRTVEVLIEKESKKSSLHWAGRNQQNTTVVFPKENFNDFMIKFLIKISSKPKKSLQIIKKLVNLDTNSKNALQKERQEFYKRVNYEFRWSNRSQLAYQ